MCVERAEFGYTGNYCAKIMKGSLVKEYWGWKYYSLP